MEEVVVEGPGPELSVAPVGKQGPEAPMIEGSSATNMDDTDFVYDHTRFRKCKAY
jgi:hypothetical protein